MLDAETKRRIDSCRDILVGKVPDPKSQVEQITIALIYKFRDDMELGTMALTVSCHIEGARAALVRGGLADLRNACKKQVKSNTLYQ